MRILALETTERVGSLAVLHEGEPVAEARLPAEQRSAASFAVGIEQLLREVGWKTRDVQCVATCVGPGSFTGLRIGVTAAKTLAYATGAKVIGVNTLEVIALGVGQKTPRLWTILDAFRGQVFAAQFSNEAGPAEPPRTLVPTQIYEVADWLNRLGPGDVVCGPMLEKLHARLPAEVSASERDDWTPRAAWVGQRAWQRLAAGESDDLWQLVPNYYRASAAEEKATEEKAAAEKAHQQAATKSSASDT
ncbi:MAG: tRNA (adenosine(37)-N6)-threonylcarbamoyltransferase complex dimerization subunit type 1 TsaB [Planctomycetota bacterium]|nr:MAG: tRNA (adenosine(37)-N6)-threonylcarbamoyltransferase complex dimerization subunit type 1 TsaB [Planctomycetota bacterium]REJ89834.1 MAG: tRNA (adenosine(37)-N6)-threonylcarbamoyltransferase complex dimerization subunit type 1 TsaB [Planctomycetota bacterium]